MSSPASAHASPAPKRGAVLPPSRIAVIVFVIVGVAVIAQELRVRAAFDATKTAIQQKMPEGEVQVDQGLFKDHLPKLLHGSPTRRGDAKNPRAETYTWNGILKKYHVHLEYDGGDMVVRYHTTEQYRWAADPAE